MMSVLPSSWIGGRWPSSSHGKTTNADPGEKEDAEDQHRRRGGSWGRVHAATSSDRRCGDFAVIGLDQDFGGELVAADAQAQPVDQHPAEMKGEDAVAEWR